jgi:hypothetical protein
MSDEELATERWENEGGRIAASVQSLISRCAPKSNDE